MSISRKLYLLILTTLLVVTGLFVANYYSSQLINQLYKDYDNYVSPHLDHIRQYQNINTELQLSLIGDYDGIRSTETHNRVKSILEIELPFLNNQIYQIQEHEADNLERSTITKSIISNSIILANRAKSILRIKKTTLEVNEELLEEYYTEFLAASDEISRQLYGLDLNFKNEKKALQLELKTRLRKTSIWIASIGAVLVLIVLLIGVVLISQIKNRFEYLKDAALQLKSGNYTIPIDMPGKDEIHELSLYFENMRQGLQANFKEIQNKNKALNESLHILESQSRRLEQANYITTHDLKSPITNIKGIVAILKSDENLSKEAKEWVDLIEKSTDNTLNVIASLNVIAKEKGSIEDQQKEMLSFSKELKEVESLLYNNIQETKTTIQADFSQCDEVYYSKTHLSSILQNLLTNSIKYKQPDVDPLIQIKTYCDNEYIYLSFEDNGIGIDLERHKDKVFGLFKRFHNHVNGKGIGLHIVHTLISENGGNITIESEVNKGTKFTCSFPKIKQK